MPTKKSDFVERVESAAIEAVLDVAVTALASAVNSLCAPHQQDAHDAAAEQAGRVTQVLALDAFCRFEFGSKNFDASAGFRSWCRTRHLHQTRLPEVEWRRFLAEFESSPVGPNLSTSPNH
jgi:hypothetical protein